MKISIMSDSHENWEKLSEAIDISNKQDCKYLLFAGDLISPQGVDVFSKFFGDVKIVFGNNENEKCQIIDKSKKYSNVGIFNEFYEEKIDSTRIFMNHYPKFSELACKSNEYDLVIHGHTHSIRNEIINGCLIVNPGEIQGFITGVSSFMIYDTENKVLDVFTL